MADGASPYTQDPDASYVPPVGGLIGNSLLKAHQRLAEKHQEAYQGLMEAMANYSAPHPEKFMANSLQDIDYYLSELIGPGYKEHQPGILKALHGAGNAILGAFGGSLPSRKMQMPPMAVDPDAGEVVQTGQAAPPSAQPVQPGQATPQAIGQLANQLGGASNAIPGAIGTTPTLLAQLAQAQAAQPRPDVAAGSVPASTLAGGGGADVSPAALQTGQPMTRADQLQAGGKLANPRDPNSPILMPLPQEVLRAGKLDIMAGRGAFGKTAQETQDFINDIHKAVAQGRMSPEEGKQNILKWITTEADPTRSTATGTDKEVYYDVPGHTDETGKKVPGHTKIMLENSRNPNTLIDPDNGQTRSLQEIGQMGWQRTSRPPSDRPVRETIPAKDPFFQEYMKQNYPDFDLSQVDPEQPMQVFRRPGTGEFVGAPSYGAISAAQSRTIEAQATKAASAVYEEQDPKTGQWKPIGPKAAERIGGDIALNYYKLLNQRRMQEMGVTAFRTGVPIEPTETLPPGVRRRADAPPITDSSLQLGGGAPGVPATPAAPPPPSVLVNPPPAAPAPAPAPAPGAQPGGAQPPAAGVPSAAPVPSGQPQPQPQVQPQPQAPPVAAQTPPQPAGGVGPDQMYATGYFSWLQGKTVNQDTVNRGRLIVQRMTGLSAPQMADAEAQWLGNSKALTTNEENAAGMFRFVNNLDQFAKQFIIAARQLPDHGSEFSNSVYRDVLSRFQNNPRLRSFQAAGAGLGTAWAGIVSNAYRSAAQLNEGALQTTMGKVNPNMTFSEIAEVMSRILLESQTERWSFDQQQFDIRKKQEANPLAKAFQFTAGNPPPQPSLFPAPADGALRKVRITGENRDRTARWDAIQGKWVEQK